MAFLPSMRKTALLPKQHPNFRTLRHHATCSNNYEDLSRELRKAYHRGGTDEAVRWLLSDDEEEKEEVPRILQIKSGADVLRAASRGSPSKSVISGIINAVLGACCSVSLNIMSTTSNSKPASSDQQQDLADRNRNRMAALTCQILESYEQISSLKPNLVSLCLSYTTLIKAENELWQDIAHNILVRVDDLHNNNNNNNLRIIEHQLINHHLLTTNEKDQLWIHHGIKVLAETESYIVVSKPSGMVCYHNDDRKAMRRKRHTSLAEVLLQFCPLSTLNGEKGRGFVHRLDRGTSGCVLLAKTNCIHAQMVAQFFLRRVKKTYHALVHTMGNNKDDASPVVMDATSRVGTAATIQLAIGGKPAQSCYKILQRCGNVAALEVRPLQGRTHQIRIHCSRVLQSPILLDPKYGGEAILFQVKSSVLRQQRAEQRFCLHARRLCIPDLGIDVVDEEPAWWKDVMEEIVNNDAKRPHHLR